MLEFCSPCIALSPPAAALLVLLWAGDEAPINVDGLAADFWCIQIILSSLRLFEGFILDQSVSLEDLLQILFDDITTRDNLHTLMNPVRLSRLRCKFLISPYSENRLWMSSSCASSWTAVTKRIQPSTAENIHQTLIRNAYTNMYVIILYSINLFELFLTSLWSWSIDTCGLLHVHRLILNFLPCNSIIFKSTSLALLCALLQLVNSFYNLNTSASVLLYF